MKHTYSRPFLFAVLLVCLSFLGGCFLKKDKEDPKPKDILLGVFRDETQAEADLNWISINDLKVGDLKPHVWSFESSASGEKIVLKDNNDYSFELSYRAGSVWNPYTKVNYSGTIPKASFTNTDKANVLKIAIVGRLPKLFMNGVRLTDPTVSTGTGGGGTTACYIGTWETGGGCNLYPNQKLVYSFAADGTGWAQNPDCFNGCASGGSTYRFTYTVANNIISYKFNSASASPCGGSAPNVPTATNQLAYACGTDPNKLNAEAINVTTNARTPLNFTRR